MTTIAYRSPDGLDYVLEQNSITLMVIIFALSLIYPVIALVSIVRSANAEKKKVTAESTTQPIK